MRGDAAQIRQVLLNLIGNACDALDGRAGTIRVQARHVHHDGTSGLDDVLLAPAGPFVQLEVVDDGIGMDREVRRHVFDPFFTTKPMGHGLGLAAVLGIVRAHGGGLGVVSAPGEGSTFRVLWPATTTAVSLPAVDAARKIVLIIDDEELVRDVIARMLEDLGYTPLVAADGMTALELVEHHRVDVALVDLSMPRMGGADVIAALRALRPGLPVILCSGYDRDGRGPVETAAYLRKPFRMEDLEATLARLLV
jgi:CheY-like chemotaxis protein